ncbi:MAG: flippase [Oscillospiraceae bacterium]|nr:flippase [Oscillospiraceae bacterium]
MKSPSLKKNFIFNAILNMSGFLFPLITFPYVARIIFPVGTGKVAFATSFVAYFNLLARLGIPTYGVRVCAKVRDDKLALSRTAHELLFINLVMSLVAYGLLAICMYFIPQVREEKLLFAVISLTIILNSIGMEWLYVALEQYSYITARSIVFKVVVLVCTFLFIHAEDDYIIYGGMTILASSASNVLNFLHARKHILMRPLGGYDVRRHMKAVMIFFAMTCSVTIYTNLDAVMLGFMTSDVDVGYYNAAVKIKNILVSMVTALGAVLLPRASYYVEHGMMDDFYRISKKALNFVLLAASSIMLYFIFFAREGIFFLSGPAYEGAVLPMQIIMPTLLLVGLTNILGTQMLVPLGREKTVLYAVIAGAVTDIILNALLIPRYAAAGAAIGTVAAELAVFLVELYALRREVWSVFRSFPYWKLVLALILGSAASLWVKLLSLGNFPVLVLSAICFFAVYALTLLVTKENLACEVWAMCLGKLCKLMKK